MRPTSWRSPGGFGEDLVTLPIRNGVDLAMPIVSFLLPQPSSHQGAQIARPPLHGMEPTMHLLRMEIRSNGWAGGRRNLAQPTCAFMDLSKPGRRSMLCCHKQSVPNIGRSIA